MLRESKESYIIQAEMRIQITTGLNFKMYLRGTLKKKKVALQSHNNPENYTNKEINKCIFIYL